MGKNRLLFDSTDKTVQIIFSNEKESYAYDTQKAAIEAIVDCCLRKKISEDERDSFIKEVLKSDLPLMEGMIGICIVDRPEHQKISEPYFKMCSCGCKPPHGYIHNSNGKKLCGPLVTKEQALTFADQIETDHEIPEKEISHLRTVITMSPLLETAYLN